MFSLSRTVLRQTRATSSHSAARLVLALVVAIGVSTAQLARADDTSLPADSPSYKTVSLQGRVVWLAEALSRRFGIETDVDAHEAIVVLEAFDGQLHPLVQDGRGRGFHLDPRMRDVDMELLVRQYTGSPFVQVIRVYTLKENGKYLFDYWCDICSIPMYELKPCECCQQEIRIRERRVDAQGEPIDAEE